MATARKKARPAPKRKNPETTFDAGDERFIVSEAKALIKASRRLVNRPQGYGLVLDAGAPWKLSTERIGDEVYAVVKRGREEHLFAVRSLSRVANPARKASKRKAARKRPVRRAKPRKRATR